MAPFAFNRSRTRREFTNIIECTDSRQVLDELQSSDIGIVLLDLTMPHRSGEELLADISERFPHVVMIVISGMNQIETAVRCMKLERRITM